MTVMSDRKIAASAAEALGVDLRRT